MIPAPSTHGALMGRFVALLSACLLSFGLSARALAEVSLRAEIEPNTIEVGEAASLSVTVEGASRVGAKPSVPAVPGLEIQSRGQSSNLSIVNGRMSQSVSFQYVVFATKAGSYTIGPIELRDGNKVAQADPVALSVVRAGATSPGSPGGAGSNGQAPADDESSFAGGALFVKGVIDKDRVVLGEQVTLRFQFWKRADVPLLDQPQYSPPETPGFWREDLPPQRTSSRNVQGQPYEVTELVYALFPTQAGRLEISGAGLECTVPTRSRRRDPFDVFGMLGGMGEPRRVKLETTTLRVQVDPLPQPAPAEFTGGVGQYRIEGALDRTRATQNEPLTLTLSISGTGNVSAVGDPKLPELIDFRAYPPTAETSPTADGNQTLANDNDRAAGKKSWKIVLIPESTGRKTVPAIRIATFDPASRGYKQLSVGPFEVVVDPASSLPSGAVPGEVARVGRDLRTIRTETHLRPTGSRAPWGTAGFWLLQLAPLSLLAAAWGYRTKLEREANDRVGHRSRRAPGRLRREVEALRAESGSGAAPADGFKRFGDALERYFTERFNFPVRGRTREELAECLRAAKVEESVITETRALLDRCDFALFAPAAVGASDLSEALAQALAIADRLDDAAKGIKRIGGKPATLRMLLAALALPLAFGLAQGQAPAHLDRAQAQTAFTEANASFLQGDFSHAITLYRDIRASGFESADLYLNLGNACYRAGRLGWAVEAFERGRRLAPNDPDLRSNLELALADTKDRQAEAGESKLLEGLVGLQDRFGMAATLRVVTLLWWLLAAWLGVRFALLPDARAYAMTGAALTALLAAGLAWTGVLALREMQRPNAVVVAEELQVRSNPDASGTVEFTLHAGTRVRLGRERAGFREVLFSERLRGWADSGALASLD